MVNKAQTNTAFLKGQNKKANIVKALFNNNSNSKGYLPVISWSDLVGSLSWGLQMWLDLGSLLCIFWFRLWLLRN